MPSRYLLLLFLGLLGLPARAQNQPDTTRAVALPEAAVTGYGQRLPLRRTAAAIGIIDARVIAQFSPTALTPAVNPLPGVRLEGAGHGQLPAQCSGQHAALAVWTRNRLPNIRYLRRSGQRHRPE